MKVRKKIELDGREKRGGGGRGGIKHTKKIYQTIMIMSSIDMLFLWNFTTHSQISNMYSIYLYINIHGYAYLYINIHGYAYLAMNMHIYP